jgi:hypothetical protein
MLFDFSITYLFFQLQVRSDNRCRLGVRDSSVASALPSWSKVFSSKPLFLYESLPQNDNSPEDVILRRPTSPFLGRYGLCGRRRIFPGRLATGDSSVASVLPSWSKVFSSKPLFLCESLPQNDNSPEDVILRRPISPFLGRYGHCGRRRIFPGRLATGDSSVAAALPSCSKVFSSKPLFLCESLPQNDKSPEDVILRRPI